MGQQSYPYYRQPALRYTFVSRGKSIIEKTVIFAPTPIKNMFHLSFGDLEDDGSMNVTANSNNGDLIKELATVIQIVKEFTKEHPRAKIFFAGSTPTRTSLYRRIIKTYYHTFSNEFIISALIELPEGFAERPFDPLSTDKYLVFYIKRIIEIYPMLAAKKHNKKKAIKRRHLPEVVVVTKTLVPANEIILPEKFARINEMHKRTTFLP